LGLQTEDDFEAFKFLVVITLRTFLQIF